MISWLKKYFIPHAGNDHSPHILRDSNIRGIVALVILLEIFAFLLPTLTHINITGGMASILPAVMAEMTNNEREAQDLRPLTVNDALNRAAEMKALDMATYSYFAHTSPEGKTPWYWIEKVGYKYQYAGENLAINFSDSKDVAAAWMASPVHKANIIKENYTEVGTGIAEGVYEGEDTVFVVQVYANPLPQSFRQAETHKPKKPEIEKTALTPATEEARADILGAEVAVSGEEAENIPFSQPTFWQKLFASPRNTTNAILFTISGIIVLSLLLYVFIKVKNYHKDLITNGLIALSIIGAIFVANYYGSHSNMTVAESLDYSNVR